MHSKGERFFTFLCWEAEHGSPSQGKGTAIREWVGSHVTERVFTRSLDLRGDLKIGSDEFGIIHHAGISLH